VGVTGQLRLTQGAAEEAKARPRKSEHPESGNQQSFFSAINKRYKLSNFSVYYN